MKFKTEHGLALLLICTLPLTLVQRAVAADYESNFEKTFSVSARGKLDIEADRGSVQVQTTADNQVQVRITRIAKDGTKGQADELFANHEVTFQQDGNSITVTAKNKSKVNRWWTSGRPNLEVRYQVSIPKSFDVQLHTAGGDVQVADLDGQASVSTSAGSIRLAKINGPVETSDAGGNIFVQEAVGKLVSRTSSGSIRIEKAGAGVDAANAGGDIWVEQAGADVVARTSSGAITVVTAQGGVNAKNAGGNIRVDKAGDDVVAETSSGSIQLGHIGKAVTARNAGGDITVQEAKANVTVSTSSGSLILKKIGGDLEARDAGGNISAEEVGGAVTAHTSSGSIVLKRVHGKIDLRNTGGELNIEEADSEVVLRTSSGAIQVGTVRGPVEARDTGGGIRIRGAYDTVKAATSSGNIDVSFAAAPKGDSRLEVSGGGIAIALPSSAAVDLDARTTGGRVITDMPLTETSEKKSNSLDGILNGGGPRLVLRASSGDIHLLSASPAAKQLEAEAPANGR